VYNNLDKTLMRQNLEQSHFRTFDILLKSYLEMSYFLNPLDVLANTFFPQRRDKLGIK